MKLKDIPFGSTAWSEIETTEHKGIKATAYWKTKNFGDIPIFI